MIVNMDRVYTMCIMLRKLLTIFYLWRRWGSRHRKTFLMPQAMGFQSKLPVLSPPPQYLFCFLTQPSSTFCSKEERAGLWLMLWKSAPEKGRQGRGWAEERVSGSLSSSPQSHTYPLRHSSAEKQNQTYPPRQRLISFWNLVWGI